MKLNDKYIVQFKHVREVTDENGKPIDLVVVSKYCKPDGGLSIKERIAEGYTVCNIFDAENYEMVTDENGNQVKKHKALGSGIAYRAWDDSFNRAAGRYYSFRRAAKKVSPDNWKDLMVLFYHASWSTLRYAVEHHNEINHHYGQAKTCARVA